MHLNTTDYLRLLAENDAYLLYEKGAPYTRLKGDVITVMTSPGRSLGLSVGGFTTTAVRMPRQTFDDLVRASFIEQDGAEDDQHRLVFRLTTDGKERGLRRKKFQKVIEALAEYVLRNAEIFVTNGPAMRTAAEQRENEQRIGRLGIDLEKLAKEVTNRLVRYQEVEAILSDLRRAGFSAPTELVSEAAKYGS